MYMDRKSDTKPNHTIQDPDYFLDVPDDENQDINWVAINCAKISS